MERESLLGVLIVLLGGVALQMFAYWPSISRRIADAGHLERVSWARLWSPLTPALMVIAWLFGWALCEPDPVPDPVGWVIFVACVPFGFVVSRAVIRAGWSLLRARHPQGIATVGLIRPQIVLSPNLAGILDDRAMRAALQHERAHMRHRDPLRIWVGQLVSDLQWPWPSARRRFEVWLAALECARDDEARAAGIDGPDLAAAILALLRFHNRSSAAPCARLTGEASALKERVARLLQPLPHSEEKRRSSIKRLAILLIPALLLALALGLAFGERVIEPLLAIAS